MRGRQHLLDLVALATLVAGCATAPISPAQLKTWVGRPAADIQREWGPATREVADGAQRILIYEQLERQQAVQFQTQTSGRQQARQAAQETANEAARGPTVYARSYLFWVDATGTIVRAEVRAP